MDKLEQEYRQRFPKNTEMVDEMCKASKLSFLDEIAECVFWRHNARKQSKQYVNKTE